MNNNEEQKIYPAAMAVALIGFGLTAVVMFVFDLGLFVSTILGCFLLFPAVAVNAECEAKEKAKKLHEEREKEQKIRTLKQYATFNDGTLVLKKRSATLDTIIKIEKVRVSSSKYVPKQLVYTGATVGGITTGGIHESGGYYRSSVNSTDKCKLTWDGNKMYHIELDDNLLELAKDDFRVSPFIKDGKIELRHNNIDVGPLLQEAMASYNTAEVNNIVGYDAIHNGLTKAECEAILAWLKGN